MSAHQFGHIAVANVSGYIYDQLFAICWAVAEYANEHVQVGEGIAKGGILFNVDPSGVVMKSCINGAHEALSCWNSNACMA
jgi:hypothetical protein